MNAEGLFSKVREGKTFLETAHDLAVAKAMSQYMADSYRHILDEEGKKDD